MERKEIYTKQQQYEEEIASYSGNDPLKLRYDFINWLDGNYGKENVIDTFLTVLEDALKTFWNVKKYQQDSRFLQLLITYVNMQSDPLEMYKTIYDRGTGKENCLLYISWANMYIKKENYRKADEIFNLGLSNVKSNNELKNSYDQFLISLGKKFLQFCCSDSGQESFPKSLNDKQRSRTNSASSISSNLENWEMNPLKVGEVDNFKCPPVCHEPPDPKKKAMYPKHLVYNGGKEYCLEEVYAKLRYEKLKTREPSKTVKEAGQNEDQVDNVDEILPKESRLHIAENMQKETTPVIQNNISEQADIHEQMQNHISAQNTNPFPKPLMLHDSLQVSHTSYTAHMKEAMNVIQEMWSSPTPAVNIAAPAKGRNYKSVLDPPKEATVNDENCPLPNTFPKKPQFSFYVEDEQPEDCIPTPNGAAIRPGMPKAMTSIKKEPLQVMEINDKRQTINVGVKQQLPFSSAAGNEENQNDMLATKLGDVSIVGSLVQKNKPPSAAIKPMLPADQDDFSDETCNTKAFNFSLPSSTPINSKKFLAFRGTESQGNVEEVQPKSIKNPAELSMILEASKERFSSSSNSTNNGQSKGHSVPAHTEIGSKNTLQDQEIDPFCPQLIERLLKSVNFPHPHYVENYLSYHTNLPTLGKSLKLGNEVYNVIGDIGKGAYAKIVKASSKNRLSALKIEKPPCKWEYYISKEIQKRVDPKAKSYFMDIRNAYIFSNGSILEMDWAPYGTLLNISNHHKVSTKKVLENIITIHFSIELVDIVHYLHQCNILHADIKPDNFIVRKLPSIEETENCVQLIDFGRSIDLRILPQGTQFTTVVKTENFTCTEMKEGKPWTFQTDLFGLAGTIHCLLVGEYMSVQKKGNEWKLYKQLPRTVRKLWDPIFTTLLNIESCDKLPSLTAIKTTLQEELISKDKFILMQHYRSLENVFKGR